MSISEITKYYKNLEETIRYGGSINETAVRAGFLNLVNHYALCNNLRLIPEISVMGTNGKAVYPDGTLKNSFRFTFGCWESKDLKDDIEQEIANKIFTGYPTENTLFENNKEVVLYQNNIEVLRGKLDNPRELDEILTTFVNYSPKQIMGFDEALKKFKQDVPMIVDDLRNILNSQFNDNEIFQEMHNEFLEVCRKEINPNIEKEDVREIIIQHILTYEIFSSIFDNKSFHNSNNISKRIEELINIVLPETKRNELMVGINSYYVTIKKSASNIIGHNEKQKFLKVFYEEFYKTYNPASADTLGVIYTPNEIVHFMIEFTNSILQTYFNKNLYDKNINILDPATGTGTFMVSIIDYIPKQYLEYKYKNEIFANEVSILPYYIANLNIEYTFYEKMQYKTEFPNICFVDTLDNTSSLHFKGQQLFNEQTLSIENSRRIAVQNEKTISVIIGNPPYNANQQNFNDFNQNRQYPLIDKRIKNTFVKESLAKKTKVYDMYSRFYRWAIDRINNDGVISFVTNRSFIDTKTYDGFRKCIEEEFDTAYIIDTKSDVRKNPKIAGTTHNIFGIQTGVAIMFLVRNKIRTQKKCNIKYYSLDEEMLKHEKLDWLQQNNFENIDFMKIEPDSKHNWLNVVDNDFDTLMPLYGKGEENVFSFASLGVSTNRTDWVTDFTVQNLQAKVKYLSSSYNKSVEVGVLDTNIKWSRDLSGKFKKSIKSKYNNNYIIDMEIRPFTTKKYYSEKLFSDMLTQNHYKIFGKSLTKENVVINFNKRKDDNSVLATNKISELHFVGDAQLFPLYTYSADGNKEDNISDASNRRFIEYYKDEKIRKYDIFAYIYGVMHSSIYKKKYHHNLSQELPKVPMYKSFWKISKEGKNLLNLHLNYKETKPYKLAVINEFSVANKGQKRIIFEDNSKGLMSDSYGEIKTLLRADKKLNKIHIDREITLQNIPPEVWGYKIANRSAIEWVLDQHKYKKSGQDIINSNFNDYMFLSRRDDVINLIAQVCALSMKTLSICKKIDSETENNEY